MYYLISWKTREVVFQHADEQTCRDIRRTLVQHGRYDSGDLVIAQGIE